MAGRHTGTDIQIAVRKNNLLGVCVDSKHKNSFLQYGNVLSKTQWEGLEISSSTLKYPDMSVPMSSSRQNLENNKILHFYITFLHIYCTMLFPLVDFLRPLDDILGLNSVIVKFFPPTVTIVFLAELRTTRESRNVILLCNNEFCCFPPFE